MQLEKKGKSQKKIKVNVAHGLGNPVSATIDQDLLSSSQTKDICSMVFDQHKDSDLLTRRHISSLRRIMGENADMDMTIYGGDNRNIQVSPDISLQDIVDRSDLDVKNIEEIEIRLSKEARGGWET